MDNLNIENEDFLENEKLSVVETEPDILDSGSKVESAAENMEQEISAIINEDKPEDLAEMKARQEQELEGKVASNDEMWKMDFSNCSQAEKDAYAQIQSNLAKNIKLSEVDKEFLIGLYQKDVIGQNVYNDIVSRDGAIVTEGSVNPPNQEYANISETTSQDLVKMNLENAFKNNNIDKSQVYMTNDGFIVASEAYDWQRFYNTFLSGVCTWEEYVKRVESNTLL